MNKKKKYFISLLRIFCHFFLPLFFSSFSQFTRILADYCPLKSCIVFKNEANKKIQKIKSRKNSEKPKKKKHRHKTVKF